MSTINIPDPIRAAFNAYGHAYKLEQAVATRSAPARRWFSILFKVDGELMAVAFQQNGDGDWEVDDDGIGPFESVREFTFGALTDRWF